MNDPPRPNRREDARREESRAELLRAVADGLAELRGVLLGIGAVLERMGAPGRGRDREVSSHDIAVELVDAMGVRQDRQERQDRQAGRSGRPPWLKWTDDAAGQYLRKIIGAAILAAAAAAGGWAFHDCQAHATTYATPKGTPAP